MGDPRKLKKKYERPKMLWEKARIKEEHGLVKEYGLKNMRELWKAQSILRKIRRQARRFLILGEEAETYASSLMQRLQRLGITKEGATINDVLGLDVKNILDRRLETVVYKKGLAITIKQSRQLITHGFIKIGDRVVRSPSYLVLITEDDKINYAKPINIKAGMKTKEREEAELPDKSQAQETSAVSQQSVENGEADVEEDVGDKEVGGAE